MRVVAHVSPDAGWPTLRNFLAATRRSHAVGMYDFGAPHIADAVEAAGAKRGFRKLTLIMQKGESVGEGTKANDLKYTEVAEQLSQALGSKFKNAPTHTTQISREKGSRKVPSMAGLLLPTTSKSSKISRMEL